MQQGSSQDPYNRYMGPSQPPGYPARTGYGGPPGPPSGPPNQQQSGPPAGYPGQQDYYRPDQVSNLCSRRHVHDFQIYFYFHFIYLFIYFKSVIKILKFEIFIIKMKNYEGVYIYDSQRI